MPEIHEIHVATEVIGCKIINCSDENHVHAVNKMYNDMVSSLLPAGEQIIQRTVPISLAGQSMLMIYMMHPEKLEACG